MNWAHRRLCRSGAWRAALEDKILPWVLEDVRLGDDLLEVGPGPGLTTDVLRTRVRRLTALEVDRSLAAALGRRLNGGNVAVVEGDGARMPFGEGSFSSAVSLTMLHHVPSPALQDRLLAEVCRVLGSGSWLVGTDSLTSLLFRVLHLGDTMVMVDPSTLAVRLERAGFVDVSVDVGPGRFRFRGRKP